MRIPKEMTMAELRDFTVRNGLFYYHIHGTPNKVAIYKDRYHYCRLGFTYVKDYRPIKNFKSMGAKSSLGKQVLRIVRKMFASGYLRVEYGELRTQTTGKDYPLSKEETELIVKFFEGEQE